MALALVCAPAFAAAQPGPGAEEEDEIEMMEGEGPEGMHPGMGGGRGPMGGPGMGQERGPMMQERGQKGQQRMVIKKRMQQRGGEGFFPEEKVLAVIKKHDPAFAKKVAEMREATPAKYKVIMQLSGKVLGAVKQQQDENLEKDAVRTLALEFESKELSLKYNKASEADRKGIKAKLKDMLSELFDLKSKAQELRVKRTEDEIGRLKKKLEKRKADKSKIVDQRLDQMTGEGYGW
jgi:uncharacterized protein (DUF2164 family)